MCNNMYWSIYVCKICTISAQLKVALYTKGSTTYKLTSQYGDLNIL